MKRVYKSPATPERLRSYVKAFPDETWEHFRRRNRRGYREVKQQLLQDQHGLCAYCEISIKLAEFEDNVDDFRVEHFFPKVATQLEKGRETDFRADTEPAEDTGVSQAVSLSGAYR